MKKIILFLMMAMMLVPIVKAQEAPTRDTLMVEIDPVCNRHRTYYYPEWWDEANNYCNDTLLSKIVSYRMVHYIVDDDMIAGEAHETIVTRPLMVKGIAVLVDRLINRPTYLEDIQWYQGAEQRPEYVSLANCNEVTNVVKPYLTVRWDTAQAQIMATQYACDTMHMYQGSESDIMYRTKNVYDSCYVYEAYFDQPVMIDSTVWILGTISNNTENGGQVFFRRPTIYYQVSQGGGPWSIVGGPKGRNRDGVLSDSTWGVNYERTWGHSFLIVDYQYYLNLEAFEDYGTVEGGGMYVDSTEVEITATPNPGMMFTRWSDGSTENPRTIMVNSDTNIVAYFEDDPNTKNVAAISSNPDMGYVIGGGYYPDSTLVELMAVARERYRFVQWENGDTVNPRYYRVANDTTFRAYFERDPNYVKKFEIKVKASNPTCGAVNGNGMYDSNSIATIRAEPFTGYRFLQWNDWETDSVRDILVDRDREFIAHFLPIDDNDDNDDNNIESVAEEHITMVPNPTHSKITITAESIINKLECYDLSGKLQWQQILKLQSTTLDVSQMNPGIYVIKIYTERGVIVKKLIVQ